MSAEVGVLAPERTWRPSLWYRFSLIVCQAVLITLPTAYIWFTLWTNQFANAGWFVVPCAVAAWAWFAFRTCTVSATLTRDTLLVRNVLATERVALADITKVTLGRGRLTVTERRPPSSVDAVPTAPARHRDPGERHTVTAITIGARASASGLRCDADEAADCIAAAAGLPALPPRKARVSRKEALVIIPIGLAFFVAGIAVSSMGHSTSHSAGYMLAGAGTLLLVPACLAELDRFRSR